MSPPGRPKGEYRSAQREGSPMSAAGAAEARSGRRRAIGRTPARWRCQGFTVQGGGP